MWIEFLLGIPTILVCTVFVWLIFNVDWFCRICAYGFIIGMGIVLSQAAGELTLKLINMWRFG